MNWSRVTVLLLVALFATNVYRAATQAITIDEAYTYIIFLAGPVVDVLNQYNANHHILHTMLCRFSIGLLGLSEFTLRIPSLLGGLLYLVVSFRLCRRLFGESCLLLFSFALLTMSPGLLDYLSAARGYGLGLAFLLSAIWQMTRFDEGGRRLELAALCLAASVASNIAFAFPGVPLAIVFTLALIYEKRSAEAIERFLLPGLVVWFSIVILPLTHASPSNFYAGVPSLGASVQSVVGMFLFHDAGGPLAGRRFAMIVELAKVLIPGVLVLAIAVCARRRRFGELLPADRVLLLSTAGLAGSLILLVGAHFFFGMPYPVRRTGIYWIPLTVLICLTLFAKVPDSRWRLMAATPCLAVGLACLVQFLLQWNVHHYSEWPLDFDNRRVAQEIAREHLRNPAPTVKVGASWSVQPSLSFYRRKYRMNWMELINWIAAA